MDRKKKFESLLILTLGLAYLALAMDLLVFFKGWDLFQYSLMIQLFCVGLIGLGCITRWPYNITYAIVIGAVVLSCSFLYFEATRLQPYITKEIIIACAVIAVCIPVIGFLIMLNEDRGLFDHEVLEIKEIYD